MRARGVTAYEHQSLSVGLSPDADLSPREAALLLQIGRSRLGFCAAGNGTIRLAQYVGLVNLGDRVLEVLPKLGSSDDAGRCRGTLLRLLRLTQNLPLFTSGTAGHDLRQDHLLEVFVAAFLEALVSLVRLGLVRRYRHAEGDINTVRGRINVPRQAAVHAMRPDMIACRFDDLTIDNSWNQVLRSALHLVGPWANRPRLGSIYLELVSALDEVTVRADALSIHESLALDRQVRHYETALHWAGWILRLLSPNLRAGTRDAPELLFDMNRLFEAAVTARLRQRAGTRGLRVTAQEPGRHLSTVEGGRPVFRLRPDIVIRDESTIVAVADTKWTRLQPDASGLLVPPDHHAYQLNAYAGAFPSEEIVLIYPWHEGHATARTAPFALPQVAGRNPQLHLVCIDVGSDTMDALVSGESLVGTLF